MNRQQALSVIKEIFEKCHSIEGKSIKLMPPKENNAPSGTYRIYIQTFDDEKLLTCIKNIAAEHNLAVKITKSQSIIYKPYPNMSEPTA